MVVAVVAVVVFDGIGLTDVVGWFAWIEEFVDVVECFPQPQ